MAKFFETLMNKFFDFFNFGRFITIIVPGLIIALCVSMLVSQTIWPAERKADPPPVTKVKTTVTTTTESKDKETSTKKETTTIVKDTAYEEPTSRKAFDPKALFKKQVAEDFQRVSGNFLLVVLLTVVIGLIIYEVGFRVLLHFPSKDNETLFRYDPTHDADTQNTKKFGFSQEPVGLVYFAPFLKEKFSGEENYYNFLITEYYRFLEFSIIMPVSIIASGMIGVAYYALFCFRHDYLPYWRGVAVLFAMLFAVAVVFLCWVSPKVIESYKSASRDLIRGASDFMSKKPIN